MKIEYCILGSDNNPFYLDFWPSVSKVWKLRFNITPILVLLNNTDISLDETYGQIKRLNPIENIPLYIQPQWARYYYTSLFPDKICIVSDIDMFPISRNYFLNQLEPYSNDKYISLSPYIDRAMLASCYHIATGKTFESYLEIPPTFKESMNKVISWGKNEPIYKETIEKVISWGESRSNYEKLGNLWFIDEIYATHMLKKKSETIYLERNPLQRLDRTNFVYTPEDIKNDIFIDCHSVRPYKSYKKEIDQLVEILVSNSD